MRSGEANRPTTRGLQGPLDRRRQRHARHQRQVGGLEAAIGEVDRGRRLRRPADAEQDHVGLLQIVRQVAVVVGQREVHRVDALEVLGVQHVLGAGPRRGLGAQIGAQQVVDRPQDRQAGRAGLAGHLLQPLAEIAPHQRVEDEARRGPDLRDHPVELRGRAHQRVDVLDRRHALVLGGGRAPDIDQRLAGGVGDEVEVEVAAAHSDRLCGRPLGRLCGRLARRPRCPPPAARGVDECG